MFPCAMGADSFHYVFGFLNREAFRQRHLRNLDIGQAEGVVAFCAGQVYVAHALAGVVVVADAVFL